ncbi:hypothetical protein BpHYR1_041401 [Brachionus plicatilis]|uniref:Uncharacterized protein n=1 Tax=Brachionus plicatilis TaxID=10195 RepID=A0A3M7QLM1_BRAPC|nr:hypothetical protein BpHYR1_041401 [Brachionus plicatilis]
MAKVLEDRDFIECFLITYEFMITKGITLPETDFKTALNIRLLGPESLKNYNQCNFSDYFCENELIMALIRLKSEADSKPNMI